MLLASCIFYGNMMLMSLNTQAQQSPWGTGSISNQNIGLLNDTTVVFASYSGYGNYGYYPNPNALLNSYTYDIYIPADYDGSKPYGLVTYINSGNNGGFTSQWLPVFDEKQLIYIAGDNIGNSVFVNTRAGVAMAAVYRLKEILNIDSTRIYASGNSGGARTAMALAYAYPEWFFGAFPNCGSNYPRQVAQDYETHQPNSHYEYTLPFTPAHLNYIKSFDRRYAMMTSFQDFREGDIMNIYHNGMEQDGMKGKILETAGFHCWTTEAQLRDAINFVEHPHIDWINDAFDSTAALDQGFKLSNAAIQGSNLWLQHNATENATANSRKLFKWMDEKGSILTTAVAVDPATFNQNSSFHLSLLSMQDDSLYCSPQNPLVPDVANILLSIVFDSLQPALMVQIENPTQGMQQDTIFMARFSDWNISDSLYLKLHLWNEEIRIEPSKHLDTATITTAGSMLLDDLRSVRIRFDDFGSTAFWDVNDFQQGCLLRMIGTAIYPTLSNSPLIIDHLEVVAADTGNLATLAQDSFVFHLDGDSLSVADHLGPFQWYLDGSPISGANNAAIQITQNGQYTLNVYDSSLCQFSQSYNVSWLKTFELDSKASFNLFPNPNNGVFTLTQINEQQQPDFQINIMNALGQVVYSCPMQDTSVDLDIATLGPGIYCLQIQNKQNRQSKSLQFLVY